MNTSIQEIMQQFQVYGDVIVAQGYGSGHINDTYAVQLNVAGTPVRYLLRRINHQIFRQPEQMMQNIVCVTDHLRSKLMQQGSEDISRRVMTVIPARSGESFFRSNEGSYWTLYLFIENARTYDVLETAQQAYEAARMFGPFQMLLSDLPGEVLFETIPHFHDGPNRYRDFETSLKADACNRARSASAEIAYLQTQAGIFDILPALVQQGKISLRITHNDTKLNNVMFDETTDKALCVIDLDTVMPGLSLYDVGDLIRTSASPTEEDEQDISKIQVRLGIVEALVKGYLESAGVFLTRDEKAHLLTGGKMITLIMATRFLTDYLQGDIYYKTHRPGHNLDRCRTQLQLLRCLNDN